MIDIEWDDVDSLTFGHSFGRLSSSTTENLCPFNHVARAQINGSRVTKIFLNALQVLVTVNSQRPWLCSNGQRARLL